MSVAVSKPTITVLSDSLATFTNDYEILSADAGTFVKEGARNLWHNGFAVETRGIPTPRLLVELLEVLTDHQHLVVLLDSGFLKVVLPKPQMTSGASEMMRMNFSLRSSRVTGPNTRVPIGASWLFSRIAALSSNLISDPS